MNSQEATILFKAALGKPGTDIKDNLLKTMIESNYTFSYSYIVCSLFIGAQLSWGLEKCMNAVDRIVPLIQKFAVCQEP